MTASPEPSAASCGGRACTVTLELGTRLLDRVDAAPGAAARSAFIICALREWLEDADDDDEAAVDRGLVEATKAAMAEGGEGLPWEQVKADLGL